MDWCTTNLRASLVTRDGTIKASIETERGIQFIETGAYEAELMTAILPWLNQYGPVTIVALGMVTSRSGWVDEAPYVPLPATAADLAASTARNTLPNGSDLIFLPSITVSSGAPYPDVMLGEETQIVGRGLDNDAMVVLPRTHSKWAMIKNHRSFRAASASKCCVNNTRKHQRRESLA